MQYERSITHLDGVAGIVSALIANNNVEALRKKIDDLPLPSSPTGRDDYEIWTWSVCVDKSFNTRVARIIDYPRSAPQKVWCIKRLHRCVFLDHAGKLLWGRSTTRPLRAALKRISVGSP